MSYELWVKKMVQIFDFQIFAPFLFYSQYEKNLYNLRLNQNS